MTAFVPPSRLRILLNLAGRPRMELEAQTRRRHCASGLTVAPTNKVHHVTTIPRVAAMLGENEDWLWDIAVDMDQQDELIWVYDLSDDRVMALTDFGIETLKELVEIHKAHPDQLKRTDRSQ